MQAIERWRTSLQNARKHAIYLSSVTGKEGQYCGTLWWVLTIYTNHAHQRLCPNTFTFKERPGATWKIIGFLIYFCFQFALPHLRKTKGNIINMSSLVAQIGQPGAVAYVASKVNLLCF